MNQIKTFLVGFGTAILTIVLFFFRRKVETRSVEESKAKVEKQKAEMSLKELEAKNEIDKKFSGLSDSDIVLHAIDEKLGSGTNSESKTDKGSR